MTRFWDGRTDRRTDGRTDGRSDCTPRPAFAFGDAGKNTALSYLIRKKNIFSFSRKIQQKISYKINQSQYHVNDRDNMLQIRNTKDL